MKKNIPNTAFELIKPIAEGLGYTLVEVLFKKEHTGHVLAVCIDKEGGINITDCEKLSRAIDKPLDEEDISNGLSYSLNVSSYGLDRIFKTDYDFNKHIDKEVIIKFYKPTLGTKRMVAHLRSFDEESVMVDYNNERITIAKKDIASMTLSIKF